MTTARQHLPGSQMSEKLNDSRDTRSYRLLLAGCYLHYFVESHTVHINRNINTQKPSPIVLLICTTHINIGNKSWYALITKWIPTQNMTRSIISRVSNTLVSRNIHGHAKPRIHLYSLKMVYILLAYINKIGPQNSPIDRSLYFSPSLLIINKSDFIFVLLCILRLRYHTLSRSITFCSTHFYSPLKSKTEIDFLNHFWITRTVWKVTGLSQRRRSYIQYFDGVE